MVAPAEGDERPLDTPPSEESGLGNSCDTSNNDSEPEAALVVPPDGGWGWVVCAASFVCNLLVDGIVFSFGNLRSDMQKDLEVAEAPVAWVGSLLSGFYLLAGPFVSALANKYGFRPVTIAGSLTCCAAFCLSYYCDSLVSMYLVYGVVGGIGLCLMYMPAVITVGFYFERWRALATGLALCGSGVGTLIVAPLTDVLNDKYGWRITIILHGTMVLICAVCALTFRPLTPITFNATGEDEAELDTKRHEEAVEKLNTMLKLHQKLDSGLSLPLEVRPGNRSTPHTWMGVPSNASYPTAAEVFRGSATALNRRSSANAAAIKGQLRSPKYTVVPVQEDVEDGDSTENNATENTNTEPLLEQRLKAEIRPKQPTRTSLEPISRPFYRDDIFFSGSLARLEQYKSHTSLGYHMAVTHVPTRQDVQEERRGCKLCPEAVRRTLATMLDVGLFKSPTFLVLAFSGFFTMLGFFVPYAYLSKRATDFFGIDKTTAMWLVPAIGVANVVGRVACGLVSSAEGVSALWLNNISITLGGVATMASVVLPGVGFQYTFCAIFGLAAACFASLRSILVVEYMGLEKLTNCFGLLLLFQGVGALLGNPIAGALKDATGTYDASFYLGGAFLIFSALICYPIDYISRWEKSRDKLADQA